MTALYLFLSILLVIFVYGEEKSEEDDEINVICIGLGEMGKALCYGALLEKKMKVIAVFTRNEKTRGRKTLFADLRIDRASLSSSSISQPDVPIKKLVELSSLDTKECAHTHPHRKRCVALVAVGSSIEHNEHVIGQCLEKGLNVVTLSQDMFNQPTIEGSLIFAKLHSLAKAHQVFIVSTGIQDAIYRALVDSIASSTQSSQNDHGHGLNEVSREMKGGIRNDVALFSESGQVILKNVKNMLGSLICDADAMDLYFRDYLIGKRPVDFQKEIRSVHFTNIVKNALRSFLYDMVNRVILNERRKSDVDENEFIFHTGPLKYSDNVWSGHMNRLIETGRVTGARYSALVLNDKNDLEVSFLLTLTLNEHLHNSDEMNPCYAHFDLKMKNGDDIELKADKVSLFPQIVQIALENAKETPTYCGGCCQVNCADLEEMQGIARQGKAKQDL